MSSVDATVTVTQSAASRFRRHQLPLPTTRLYRCNLSALSQTHNLYFIARGSKIYIYSPLFPSYSLPCHPLLVFATDPSPPPAPAHVSIDPQSPHDINHLLVAFLGRTEVIAVARDDGEVELYAIDHLRHALDRRNGRLDPRPASDVRPFHRMRVASSAWGIALHTDARLLAVSSNDHCVTFVEFGLVDSDTRPVDTVVHVLNGDANIPAIAFCNSGADPDGCWLLTTDIDGVCRLIHRHSLGVIPMFRCGPASDVESATLDPLQCAGWGIAFLDLRAFPLDPQHESPVQSDAAVPQRSPISVLSGVTPPPDLSIHPPSSTSPAPASETSTHNNSASTCSASTLLSVLSLPILYTSAHTLHLLRTRSLCFGLIPYSTGHPLARLNLLAHIPPLGLLFVASQHGILHLLALARATPASAACTLRHVSHWELPSPLAGVAASPVPGAHGAARWRVVAEGVDGAVWAAEVTRRMGGHDVEDDGVDSLVV